MVFCLKKEKTKFIIPIDKEKEELDALNSVYCPVCKEKGTNKPVDKHYTMEDGYKYDVMQTECSKCYHVNTFKFFIVEENIKMKELDYYEYRKFLRQLDHFN